MTRYHPAQFGRLQHLGLVVPSVEMPAHLDEPARPEGHDQGAVLFLLGLLVGKTNRRARAAASGANFQMIRSILWRFT